MECDALVNFVRALPVPVVVAPPSPREAIAVEEGRKLFLSIGCADCHTTNLGGIPGLYSDLLLHDMGEELGDQGNYYGLESPDSASDTEWRTPPLWGFRDSGPYLHDGRAKNLYAAVSHHGGQGAEAARRYRRLSLSDQSRVRAFLMSLAAPAPGDQAGGLLPAAPPGPDRPAVRAVAESMPGPGPVHRTSVLGGPSNADVACPDSGRSATHRNWPTVSSAPGRPSPGNRGRRP
jgi:mono/diheme cytochrome c family protein